MRSMAKPSKIGNAMVPSNAQAIAPLVTMVARLRSNSAPLRKTVQSTSQKNNQLPPKSSVWPAHAGTDKNLVISFSDDDSGSDSEDYRQEKTVESKGNSSRLENNQKPPTSSLTKSYKLHNNARNVHKSAPKRLPVNQMSISSVTKILGPNSKGVGSLSLGQGSRARNFNTLNKNLASNERKNDQGVVSNNNKLQDLRQQIALRESELKLKAAQQNKEPGSVLGRDHNAIKLKSDPARKYTSSENAQLEPKEPDRKRLKLGKSHATTQVFGTQQEVPAAKSIFPSKESALDKYNLQERNKVDRGEKETSLSRGEPIVVKSQGDDKCPDVSSKTMPSRPRNGADIKNNYNQTDKQNRLVDPCVTFNRSSLPANMTSNSVPKNKSIVELSHPLSSNLNKATNVDNLKSGLDYNNVISQDNMVEHSFNNACQEALNNTVNLNCSDNANHSDHSSMDLHAFIEMELIDKELEEAQKHRHKCEAEERNALKVYLKAQRALIEANGRCTHLYRKRELYSAKLRSLILNNSGFSWSSGQHEHLDTGLDYLPRPGYVIPTSSCQRQVEYNDINQPGFDTTVQGVNNGLSNASYDHINGANLGFEHCSEPDASTSEPLPQRGNTADGFYSPSDEIDTSANDNEEMSPAIHVSTNHDTVNQRKQYSKAKLMDIDAALNARPCAEIPQDPLLLEAALRSELVARLGTRTSKSSSTRNNPRPAAEQRAENEVGSEKNLILDDFVLSSKAGENDFKGKEQFYFQGLCCSGKRSRLGVWTVIVTISLVLSVAVKQAIILGHEKQERNIYLDPAEIQIQQNTCGTSLISNCNAGDGGYLALQGQNITSAMKMSPWICRSAFSCLKQMSVFNSKQLSKNQWIHVNDDENEKQYSNTLAISVPFTGWNVLSEESSFSCSPAVDPFWPLCMYELRGKCNNDECPWQHVKDYCDGNYQNQHSDYDDADCQGGLSSHQPKFNGATKVPKSHRATILPTYLVGLDILRADQLAYKSVLAHRNTQFWQKCFSLSLTTSNLLQHGLPVDGQFFNGGDERIENQNEQDLVDNEQAVEMALLVLNQEINKLEGVRKALSKLSRILETDPTSVLTWVVYLLIYYGNLKPTGKDDMFLYAVKHNEGSYVLWLMYINSRMQLDDRLAAYDAALSALCQHASSSVKDRIHSSACILDLFLQMMDCLCMSGNVEKAIQKSYGVFHATTKSNKPDHLSLSDILNCLTVSDKCVFWVCCVYLVIYRKLPDAVVQKFECDKDNDIEWPFVELSKDEKQVAVKLVETAVESVDSYIYNESEKNEVNLRSAQLFALNHIRCMVALGNLECFGRLLDKYVKLYPYCIELVLVSARIQKQENGVDSFMGFDEAISRWPKETPGIQCIWNQYIENAVQDGKIDFAKELAVRWFDTAWKVQDAHDGELEAKDGGNSCGSLGFNLKSLPGTSSSELNQMDVVFGFLNLSIYKFFQNDETEAFKAVDNAGKAANFGDLDIWIRKYAMFLLSDASSLKENGPNNGIKKILEIYTDGFFQDFLVPELLTRKFLDNVKKPRVQQLISNLLGPVSFDFSLLNWILQSWYGSSLLPQTFSDPKDLVDFVEAILEVVPSNFQLAISVCKLLSKGYNSAKADQSSASLWFWASSTLVNAILDAIPIPPEYVWVEAGVLLSNVMGIEAISERFYKRALSVHPFSVRLWKSFYNLCKASGEVSCVIKAAKERAPLVRGVFFFDEADCRGSVEVPSSEPATRTALPGVRVGAGPGELALSSCT
ncbi:uncharacterized protein G2W53_027767 [Senna tora]|uniref:Putative zinc-finger domain-containing protein n=1 Tax=Senna tora TaxID=362788 RepID=A0A834THH7_9FABA|nr:uncharacterized protein G2W53_027767 [Senna tora]